MKISWIVSIVSIIFATIVFVIASGFEASIFGDDYAGPDYFPKIAAGMMFILAIILPFTTKTEAKLTEIKLDGFALPMIMVVVLVLYLLIIEPVGFVIATFVLCIIILKLFNVKKMHIISLFAFISVYTIYLLFTKLLTVSLPEGELPELIYKAFPVAAAVFVALMFIVAKKDSNKQEETNA